MSNEVELFDLGNVLVTNKSFYVLHRSFPLQSISNVEVIYHQRNWMPVVAPFVRRPELRAGSPLHAQEQPVCGRTGVDACDGWLTFYKGGLRYTIALDTDSRPYPDDVIKRSHHD